MNRRIVFGILLAFVLVLGGGLIAASAYQAGLASGIAQSGTVAAPVVVPYAYGWHPFGIGFGLFGFLGLVLFLFLLFGLIRAVTWGGRGWGRGGWGGRWGPGGPGGPGGPMQGRWEEHAHSTFDDWHRRAHEGPDRDTAQSPPATPSAT